MKRERLKTVRQLAGQVADDPNSSETAKLLAELIKALAEELLTL